MYDPTDHVRTLDSAVDLACVMLHARKGTAAPAPEAEVWKACSEPVLAALLYNASPSQRGGGISWVNNAVSTLADGVGDPADAFGIDDPAGLCVIRRLVALNAGQRYSVLLTVREAITPWLAA